MSLPARPYAPTGLHLRAVGGSAVTLLLAVLLRRPDLVVVAVPLLAVAVWGRLARPRGVPRGTLPLRAGDVGVGRAVALRLDLGDLDGADTVALSPAPADGLAVAPAGHLAAPRDGRAVVDLTVEPTRWGRHTLDVGQVHVRSAWGAYDSAWVPGEAPEVVAVPAPGAGAAPPSRTTSRRLGAHPAPTPGHGGELRDIREYVPGDRPRLLHWRSTLRTGRPQVRTMHAEGDLHVALVVDVFGDLPGDPAGGPGDAEGSLARSVRAAADVATRSLAAGDRVSLRLLGSEQRPVDAGTGPAQAARVLGTLARVTPGTARVPREALLRLVLPRGTVVVVVTALTEELVVALAVRHLRQGCRVVVLDTAPATVVPADDAGRLAARLVHAERVRTAAALRERGVVVVPWTGPASFDRAVALLARRGAR